MLKSKNVRLFKALAMGALLSNGGISAEKENRQDQGHNKPLYNVGAKAEADRDEHTAKFASSLLYIAGQGDQISQGLKPIPIPLRSDRMPRAGGSDNHGSMVSFINQYLELLEQRARDRQNMMGQPRTIDLSVKSFDNVRNFLENARRYSARAKLRLLNITPQQLDEILNSVGEEIEELDWTYQPMPISGTKDLDEDGNSLFETKTSKDLDDEEEDDEFETTGKGKKSDKDHDDDDIEDGKWENHVDRDGIAVPRPRRAAARGRDPLGLADLIDDPEHRANLVPPNRIVDVPVPAANANYVPVHGAHGNIVPNDQNNPFLVNVRLPLAKSYPSSSNPSNFEISRPHTQVTAHHLVNVFCKNHTPKVDVR